MIKIKFCYRLSVLLVSLILCLSVLQIPVNAGSVAEIIFGSVTAGCDEEISVAVTVKNNPGIAGFRFRVNYDSDKLELLSVEKGDALIAGTMIYDSNDENSSVTFLWYSIDDVFEDGEIAVLRFRTTDSVNGVSILDVDYLDNDIVNSYREPVNCVVTNGMITFGYGVSVVVNDYNNSSDPAIVKLISNGPTVYESETVNGVCTFDSVSEGSYTVEVSKSKYRTAVMDIYVSRNSEIQIPIYLLGDMNYDKKINARDKAFLTMLIKTGELTLDGDLNYDGKVNARDKAVITQIIKGVYY